MGDMSSRQAESKTSSPGGPQHSSNRPFVSLTGMTYKPSKKPRKVGPWTSVRPDGLVGRVIITSGLFYESTINIYMVNRREQPREVMIT